MLGRHDDVRAAVGLARDHRDEWHGRLGVRVDELGAAANDALVLLANAWQKAGHIDKSQHGHVERVAGADKARCLLGRADVHIVYQ